MFFEEFPVHVLQAELTDIGLDNSFYRIIELKSIKTSKCITGSVTLNLYTKSDDQKSHLACIFRQSHQPFNGESTCTKQEL